MANRRRIIVDSSSDEDSSVEQVPSPAARRRAVMKRGTLYDDDDDSSNSSESLEGLLNSLKISSPAAASEDGSIERWFASTDIEKLPAKQEENTAEEVDSDSSVEFVNAADGLSSVCSNESGEDISRVEEENDLDAPWNIDQQTDEYFFDASRDSTRKWPNFRLPGYLFRKLYDYQVTGVQWMGGLHHKNIGGVLGDDMGMGKTFMAVAYITGLMKAGTIRNCLIVAPVSVLRSWEKEAQKVLAACVPRVQIIVLSSDVSKQKRERLLDKALKSTSALPYFVISTYGMVRNSTSAVRGHNSDRSYWDYIICDEAHTLKNHNAQVSQSCRAICKQRTRRLMLTGTPIMNRLTELWSVFDWATSGKVLGQLKEYKEYFSKPIELARDKYASKGELERGQRVNTELQELLAPFFLQRSKIDYLSDRLPTKTEFVVWTHLSSEQRQVYSDFLEEKSGLLHNIANGKSRGALEAITFLKKLCGHPLLVEGKELPKYMDSDEIDEAIHQCSKLGILLHLVSSLCSQNHRVLVFSQSTKMLDVIEAVLAGVIISRIDGQTKERDRQRLVDGFNDPSSNQEVMLLSTKAAGVGLTLTGASRVVVYDPSWTPAEDSQAVDRAYRIGQKREVVVYRLIAAGTVEEKMYEKQIHKDGITRTVFTTGETVERYFDKSELSSMFVLGDPGACETMEKVRDLKADWSTQQFLLSHGGVVGLSRHDGFYRPASVEDKEPGTRGIFEAATPAPKKVKGKSQRVLQIDNSDDEDGPIPLGRNRSSKQTLRNSQSPSIQRRNMFDSTQLKQTNATEPSVIDLSEESLTTPTNTPSSNAGTHFVGTPIDGSKDDDSKIIDNEIPRVIAIGPSGDDTHDEAGGYDLASPVVVNRSSSCSILRDIYNSPQKTPGRSNKERLLATPLEMNVSSSSYVNPSTGSSFSTRFLSNDDHIAFLEESLKPDSDEGLSADEATVVQAKTTAPKHLAGKNEPVSYPGAIDSRNETIGVTEPIADVWARAESLATCGFPKKSLRVLMDVLDNRYDEIGPSMKIDFHQRIASLSSSLGILHVEEGN